MRWLNPEYLALLLLVGGLGWLLLRSHRLRATLRFPAASMLRGLPRTWGERLAFVPRGLRLAALVLLVLAMARPQSGQVERRVTSRGFDIVLVIDVSGSMRARDFEPDRLGAAKDVVKEFIKDRKGDQLAVVLFATSAYTFCPPTLDFQVVGDFVDRIEHDIIDGNQTAIGMGLATALKSLRESKAESRIVILLTDGQNNAGAIPPMQAAEAAKALGVRVYTIGVGTRGVAMVPARDSWSGRDVLRPMQVDIDEQALTQIADMTGGKYYRATDKTALKQIYTEIDQLEKSKIEFVEHDSFNERGEWLILAALGFLLLELLVGVTRLGGIP